MPSANLTATPHALAAPRATVGHLARGRATAHPMAQLPALVRVAARHRGQAVRPRRLSRRRGCSRSRCDAGNFTDSTRSGIRFRRPYAPRQSGCWPCASPGRGRSGRRRRRSLGGCGKSRVRERGAVGARGRARLIGVERPPVQGAHEIELPPARHAKPRSADRRDVRDAGAPRVNSRVCTGSHIPPSPSARARNADFLNVLAFKGLSHVSAVTIRSSRRRASIVPRSFDSGGSA